MITARGKFQDSTTLLLEGDDPSIPEDRTLTFDHLILATGSVPAMPKAFQVGPRVMDSTGALQLEDLPDSLLVVGGGYIGLEMGTVYAQLGTQVSVVELTDGLLPGADRDLVRPLEQRLKKLFEDRIYLSTKLGTLNDMGDQVEVTFEGPNKFGVERFDRVLVSVGRRPASASLGLENTQVKLDQRGFAQSDSKHANQRSAHPGHRRRGRGADAGAQSLARRQGRRGSPVGQARRVRQGRDPGGRLHGSRNRLGWPHRGGSQTRWTRHTKSPCTLGPPAEGPRRSAAPMA